MNFEKSLPIWGPASKSHEISHHCPHHTPCPTMSPHPVAILVQEKYLSAAASFLQLSPPPLSAQLSAAQLTMSEYSYCSSRGSTRATRKAQVIAEAAESRRQLLLVEAAALARSTQSRRTGAPRRPSCQLIRPSWRPRPLPCLWMPAARLSPLTWRRAGL